MYARQMADPICFTRTRIHQIALIPPHLPPPVIVTHCCPSFGRQYEGLSALPLQLPPLTPTVAASNGHLANPHHPLLTDMLITQSHRPPPSSLPIFLHLPLTPIRPRHLHAGWTFHLPRPRAYLRLHSLPSFLILPRLRLLRIPLQSRIGQALYFLAALQLIDPP